MHSQKYYLFFCFIILQFKIYGQYNLKILSNQTYSNINLPEYTVYDTTQEWDNSLIKPNFNFTSFNKIYPLTNGVYAVIQQGYIYFINSTNSTTIYVAEGIYSARKGINQTSSFSFKKDTLNNENVFKLEWKNIGFLYGDSTHFSNFQIFLFEKSGIIKINFGPSNIKPGLYAENLNGPSISLLEMDDQFSTIYNLLVVKGNYESATLNKQSFLENLNTIPSNGTSYEFTPVNLINIKNNSNTSPPVLVNLNENKIRLNWQSNETLNFNLKIYNSIGQNIYQSNIQPNITSIDLPLEQGIYYITLENEKSNYTFKLIQ